MCILCSSSFSPDALWQAAAVTSSGRRRGGPSALDARLRSSSSCDRTRRWRIRSLAFFFSSFFFYLFIFFFLGKTLQRLAPSTAAPPPGPAPLPKPYNGGAEVCSVCQPRAKVFAITSSPSPPCVRGRACGGRGWGGVRRLDTQSDSLTLLSLLIIVKWPTVVLKDVSLSIKKANTRFFFFKFIYSFLVVFLVSYYPESHVRYTGLDWSITGVHTGSSQWCDRLERITQVWTEPFTNTDYKHRICLIPIFNQSKLFVTFSLLKMQQALTEYWRRWTLLLFGWTIAIRKAIENWSE